MTRLPAAADDETDPIVAEVFAAVRERGASIPLLYGVLANSPELLKAWTDLAWPLRYVSDVPRALRELMIMRTAQLTGARYEWAHHWHLAVQAGVRESQLEELADWRGSAEMTPHERAVLAFTDELVGAGHVSDETFTELRTTFDDRAVVQLALTASFYVCVGRMAAAVDLDLEPEYESVPGFEARLRLAVIVGSTRPDRAADGVAAWVRASCEADSRFDVDMLDLRDWPLPFFAERVTSVGDSGGPEFSDPVVAAWNETIGAADAYVMITPEYNRGVPAVLKNALDSVFLTFAFRNKPAGLVGYSSSYTAGARAVEHLALVARDLELVALRNSVLVPNVATVFSPDGEMQEPRCTRSMAVLLDDLAWWGRLLTPARMSELPPGQLRRLDQPGRAR